MSFEKFGVVSHTKEGKASDFVTYLEQGKVMATRCRKCQTSYFPPQVDCPKCLISDMEWFEITGSGKLITFSVVNYGPLGFEDRAPYIVAIGEFEDGVKIFATFSQGVEEQDITVGMPLKVAPVKLPGDRISYEFQTG